MRCSWIDTAWPTLVDMLRTAHGDWSTPRCAATARELLETVAFLGICQARGLLPDCPPEALFDTAIEQLGEALVSRPDEPVALLQAIAMLPPELYEQHDLLQNIHIRLLSLRLDRLDSGRSRARRTTGRRKAEGIYYTPDTVADYMVQSSLAALGWQTERDASPRLLDPACGCGEFLLAACRNLFAHQANDLDARAELLGQIHGVDSDTEAVLVARRRVWLETVGTGPTPPRMISDRLAQAIRAADALTDGQLDRQSGMFDLLLGNPPYRRELGAKGLLDRIAESDFGRRWRSARMDLWHYFAHRGLDLLADGGVLCFLVNGYWTGGRGSKRLIERLEREARIEEIFDFEEQPLFEGVAGRHLVFRVRKNGQAFPRIHAPSPPTPLPKGEGRSLETTVKRVGENGDWRACLEGQRAPVVFTKRPEQLFRAGRLDLEPPCDELLAVLAQGTPLGRLGKVRQGIAENPATINRRTNLRHGEPWTVGQGVFSLSPEEVEALDLSEAERALLRLYHALSDLGRYRLASPSRVLIYSTAQTWPELDAHPALRDHLARFRPILDVRRETQLGKRPWWQLHWPREASLWESPKLLALQMAPQPAFVPAMEPAYVSFSVNVFAPAADVAEHLYYFTALLNSRLYATWFAHHAKRRGVGLEINGRVLAATPIHRIDFDRPEERAIHNRLVDLAAEILTTPDGPARAALDSEIDQVVCTLHGVEPEQCPDLV
ncbi:MAG: N-6 DNA methylase [Pirellulales bacterium]|nr:N-6 DNA methylase [Pirellulales bacterium]